MIENLDLWLKINFVFIIIKILPLHGIFSSEPKDWYIEIDPLYTKPVWFTEALEKKCLDTFFQEVYPKCVFIGKKDLIFKDRKNLFLKDCSTELYNSSAELYDSSAVVYGSSLIDNLYTSSPDDEDFYDFFDDENYVKEINNLPSIVLHGSSSAKLYGHSSADVYDTSSVELYDASSLAKLHDSSTATSFSKNAKIINKK